MRRPTKTMRRKRQTRQRSRRHRRSMRRHTRRQRGGGSLPVPAGAIVAISSGGEYGVPLLMSKEQAEVEQEKGSLED